MWDTSTVYENMDSSSWTYTAMEAIRDLAEKSEKSEKSKYEDAEIDYTVLSVAVLTLGLLICVDLIRHKIDHDAMGRPFFETVLDGVYRELATLGIVEFGVYLLQTYYTQYNKAMKAVFADVHFMLFYTAIFNALLSALIAVCTSRVSDRLWVRTEQLDVDNYLELRAEFELVERKLLYRHEDRTAEAAFEYNIRGVRRFFDSITDTLRNPRLLYKYNELLIQIRFHELRVQFLKANDLPLKLKVSDYLKRSELSVLKKLVHISPFAWLLLTGGINLVYFLMGIVAYVTESPSTIGVSLSALFIGCLAAFVVLSAVMLNKMKSIFTTIMHTKLIKSHGVEENDGYGSDNSSEQEADDQLQLFWGSQPSYIIIMTKLMTIGFAVAVSILLVFYGEMKGGITAGSFAAIIGSFLATFVYLIAQVIPRFTLCTSLGLLVNQRRLGEILASFHLEETRRKQRILREAREAEKMFLLENEEETHRFSDGHSVSARSAGLSSKASALELAIEMKASNHDRADSEASDDEREFLSTLVQAKTEDLPELLSKSTKEDRTKARKEARKKALSDGVQAMRSMRTSKHSDTAMGELESVEVVDKRSGPRRSKAISANASVHMMQSVAVSGVPLVSSLKPTSADDMGYDDDSDGESVVDAAHLGIAFEESKEVHHEETFADSLRTFFKRHIYRRISASCGTMVAFFLVGMRVEALLLQTYTMGDPKNTWHFEAGAAFWLETAWLSMFILISFWQVILFRPGRGSDNKSPKFFIAATLDCILCSVCLFLLMASETQRKCDKAAGIDCTKTFGNRVGEGVGNIEPFTSLVGLRIFRYVTARFILRCMDRPVPEPPLHQSVTIRPGEFAKGESQAAHGPEEHGHDHGHGHGHDTGTLLELWQRAVGAFPDVVEKYGEFSGQLLQAMLGLDIIDDQLMKPTPPPGQIEVSASAADGEQSSPTPVATAKSMRSPVEVPKKNALSLSGRNASLPKEVQAIILAGKIGKPVKTTTTSLRPGAPLEFEIDTDKYKQEMLINANNELVKGVTPFIAPNAPIVRSMRRCDRKLLPLLNHWTAVDVVMTRYEIVYFDASADFEKEMAGNADKKIETLRQALGATHGGKGLRLCDVAEGRKVVGHLELSSIDNVHVERTIPSTESASKEHDTSSSINEDVKDEYWKPAKKPSSDIPRNQRWDRVKTDHLRIVTKNQVTLLLRFYGDLKEIEANPDQSWNEQEDSGDLNRNNAFRWGQTVIRLCGVDQLKHQHLPHFGDGTSEELRDFLEVVDHNHHGLDGHRIPGMRKKRHNTRRPSPTRQRSSTVGENSGDDKLADYV